MIYAEPRMPPREHVSCKLLINELSIHKKADNNLAKILGHFLQPGKWEVVEVPVIVKPTFQNNRVKMRVPLVDKR